MQGQPIPSNNKKQWLNGYVVIGGKHGNVGKIDIFTSELDEPPEREDHPGNDK
jgi:hypothetical protein